MVPLFFSKHNLKKKILRKNIPNQPSRVVECLKTVLFEDFMFLGKYQNLNFLAYQSNLNQHYNTYKGQSKHF